MWFALFTSYSCFGITFASNKCFDSISKNRSKLFFIITFIKINYGFWCSWNYSDRNYYRRGRVHPRVPWFSERFPDSRSSFEPSPTGNGRTPYEYGQFKGRDLWTHLGTICQRVHWSLKATSFAQTSRFILHCLLAPQEPRCPIRTRRYIIALRCTICWWGHGRATIMWGAFLARSNHVMVSSYRTFSFDIEYER